MLVYSSSNMKCIYIFLPKTEFTWTFISTWNFLLISTLLFQTNFLLTDYSHDILNQWISFIAIGHQMDDSINLGQRFVKKFHVINTRCLSFQDNFYMIWERFCFCNFKDVPVFSQWHSFIILDKTLTFK